MPPPNPIAAVFERLDTWRHQPAYQLERRADIFFAIYLAEVITAYTGVSVSDSIIPEFPIKRDLIWPETPSMQSVKVDYCLCASDRSRIFLVELKTDLGSRRGSQDKALARAVELGFRRIVEGVREIVVADRSYQRKYHHLVSAMASLGFLSVPDDLADLLYPKPRRGLASRLREIEVTTEDLPIEVIYIQPTAGQGDRCIDFEQFARHVERHDDPLSRAFAEHLRRWVTPAGSERPGGGKGGRVGANPGLDGSATCSGIGPAPLAPPREPAELRRRVAGDSDAGVHRDCRLTERTRPRRSGSEVDGADSAQPTLRHRLCSTASGQAGRGRRHRTHWRSTVARRTKPDGTQVAGERRNDQRRAAGADPGTRARPTEGF